jgi:hypothetical protein
MLTAQDRQRLQPAADAAGYSLDTLEVNLVKGHAMLWHVDNMTATSEVDEDDVCDMRLCGGKMTFATMRELERVVTTSPFHVDVIKYRIWGRKGWLRLYPHWKFVGMEDGLVILERSADEK